MKLLEVVRGGKTAKDVLATVMSLAKRSRRPRGLWRMRCFIGNRMVEQYLARRCSAGGRATPGQVDSALESWAWRWALPHVGSGGQRHRLGHSQAALPRAARFEYSKIADRLCEKGRFGQKTGLAGIATRPAAAMRFGPPSST